MGLGAVELILAVEETFGIEIPDEEASHLVTVGDLHKLIVSKLAGESPGVCVTLISFQRFRRAIQNVCDVSRSEVTPSTRVDQLIPRAQRRLSWRRLQTTLGLSLPRLRRSVTVRRAIGGGTLAIVFAAWLSGILGSLSWFAAGLACSAMFLATALEVTRPLAVFLPHASVGALCVQLRDDNYGEFSRRSGRYNDDEAWTLLRNIICRQLELAPDRVQLDSRLVRDLDLG